MSLARCLSLLALFVLAACAQNGPDTKERQVSRSQNPATLARFAPKTQPTGVARSNSDIAQDFLDLTFALETGKTLDRLLKFEGEVGVMLHGNLAKAYRPELTNLITRLRSEARVQINETATPERANIHVHAITKREISRVFPGAACFIVPNVRNWEEFRGRSRSRGETRWSALNRLSVISVFLPADGAPQDIRDCLHEEIAQALGPANDLYRLSDSIFNDDNFHAVLTPFDMLILRTLYSPQISAGMTREEVARVLPNLLNRLNPSGRSISPRPRVLADLPWKTSFENALTGRSSTAARRSAAARAVSIAREMQPSDHRLGISLLTLGRSKFKENETGDAEFREAYTLHEQLFGRGDIRTAHAAVHIGILALRDDDSNLALEIANGHIDAARKAENAVVLSSLLAIRSEALIGLRQIALARTARLESLGWARYAYGDRDGRIAESEARVAALPIAPTTRAETPK